MNLDRYLATVYPLFHRASVTRRRLLIVLVIFLLFEITLTGISVNNLVISDQVATVIFGAIVSPMLFYINYNLKLFFIARKMGKNNKVVVTPGLRKPVDLRNISCCLLAVVCLVCLHLPITIYIVLSINENASSFNVKISWLWTKTILTTNSTFNCLIFFWKNRILRMEGRKVVKILKGMTVSFDQQTFLNS